MFRSNRSNRIETIIMIFRQPTTPQANCKNHVKVVMAFQGPVTDSKLKRSLDDRSSSAICTVLGMFMGWRGYNPRATFLFASNKFTWDHVIPLHFGCRHMWIFITFVYIYVFQALDCLSIVIIGGILGQWKIHRTASVFSNFSFNPSITVAAFKLTCTSWSKNIAE